MIELNAEVAEQEFYRWAESMDLDFNESNMDASDISQFKRQKSILIKAIIRNSLVINDSGEFVYTPQHKRSKYSEPITFYERDGASLTAMDGKKTGHDVAKMYAVLAAMCKVPPKTFTGLVGADIRVSEAIFALLMG